MHLCSFSSRIKHWAVGCPPALKVTSQVDWWCWSRGSLHIFFSKPFWPTATNIFKYNWIIQNNSHLLVLLYNRKQLFRIKNKSYFPSLKPELKCNRLFSCLSHSFMSTLLIPLWLLKAQMLKQNVKKYTCKNYCGFTVKLFLQSVGMQTEFWL